MWSSLATYKSNVFVIRCHFFRVFGTVSTDAWNVWRPARCTVVDGSHLIGCKNAVESSVGHEGASELVVSSVARSRNWKKFPSVTRFCNVRSVSWRQVVPTSNGNRSRRDDCAMYISLDNITSSLVLRSPTSTLSFSCLPASPHDKTTTTG